MRRLAHIVNAFRPHPSSDLFTAQPVTLETMRIASEFARGRVEVSLLSAQYPEDRCAVPEWVQSTRDLDRSVADLGHFQEPRRLPLLADVLDRLYEASDAEYLIYTNMDIALMPHFYVTVDRLIDSGCDGLVINRRTISTRHRSPSEIPLMFAEVGRPHEGHDCFVFRREAYPNYELGLPCLGTPWVGRILLWNVVCHATSFQELTQSHLTFHIGEDRPGEGNRYADYIAHNRRELLRVRDALERRRGPFEANGRLARYVTEIRDELGFESQWLRKSWPFIRVRNKLARKLGFRRC